MSNVRPLYTALVEQGYAGSGKLLNFVIDEKNKTGIAVVKLQSIEEPFNIYYDNTKGRWTEVEPKAHAMVNPSIIEKHYCSAI